MIRDAERKPDPRTDGGSTTPVSRRTKIVATLGPASDDPATLRAMIRAGMNAVRINFSHQKTEMLGASLERVRAAARECETVVAILGDLQGPRIRVGEMADGAILLQTGAEVTLTPRVVIGRPDLISISFGALANDVVPGSPLLLDDGNLLLRVREVCADGELRCAVERGGTLHSRRGINLPGQRVSLPSLTDKDFLDIDLAIAHGFDFLALSFVQSAEDVRGLVRYLAARGADIPVIAKIEKKSALHDIEAITQAAYGVMVARGDLALEMSLAEVPVAQKQIIAACRQAACPVITATQMLESMTQAPKPTRAEATDVANAIFDGTDAVMLSGESALGKYPVETIAIMSAIACRAEAAWLRGEVPAPAVPEPRRELETVVARGAWEFAQALGACAIVTYTTSGATCRRVSCYRPDVPILALCEHVAVQRRLALIWGVEAALAGRIESTAQMSEVALRLARERCGAQVGDIVVIVAGTPYRVRGKTNLIKVERILSPDGDEAMEPVNTPDPLEETS